MDTSTALSLRGGDWCKSNDTPLLMPTVAKLLSRLARPGKLRRTSAIKAQPKAVKRGRDSPKKRKDAGDSNLGEKPESHAIMALAQRARPALERTSRTGRFSGRLAVCEPRVPLELGDSAYDEDRKRSEVEHLVGRAADDEPDEIGQSSRADDDQGGLRFDCLVQDGRRHPP